MTNRLARLLDPLARLLLIGTFAAPLILVVAQAIPSRPDVRWAVSVPWFGGPRMGVPIEDHFDPPWGFSMVVVNQGPVDSEDVRIVLDLMPSNLDVAGRSLREYELIPTDEGAVIDLGPLEPHERIELTVFRVNGVDVDSVLHGGQPIEITPRPPLFDFRVRLPRWALLAGLFLLAGLALQVLAMRSRPTSAPTR